jgi:hypothetical protein
MEAHGAVRTLIHDGAVGCMLDQNYSIVRNWLNIRCTPGGGAIVNKSRTAGHSWSLFEWH